MNSKQLDAMEDLVNEHYEIQEEMAKLEKRLATIKSKLMQKMEDAELETITLGEEGATVKVTIVRPTTLKIDEEGLKEALPKVVWNSITKTSVDKKALEDAVVRGKIEPSVVASNSKEVASKPYLRITG